jgi:MFS family permease
VRRERLLPLIVASALFIENMESTAISTSLPEIAADLGVEAVVLKLALTAYMLALAVFIPISGWVSDRFGSQRTFMAAIAVFMCGSIACAASNTLGGLITARFMQGIGGAMMVPVGRLVLLRSIEKSQLVRALSWLTVPALLGPMLGPVVGGFITTYSHWRYIFLVNLPIGALGIWFAWRHIPQLYGPVGRLDWVGFFLSSMGLAATMFGLSMLGRQMAGTALLLGVSVVGVSLLVMYVLHAKRHPHPLINLELFRVPTYRIGVLGGALFRIGVGATPLLLPLMLQLGFGYDPLESGLITFAGAAGAMFMKTVAAWILKRFGRLAVPGAAGPVPRRHALRADGRRAADRRLLPLAAVHQPQRDHLRRHRPGAHVAGEQPCRHGPADRTGHRRHHRRLCAVAGQHRHRSAGRGQHQLHAGLRHHRVDLAGLGVLAAPPGTRRRRRNVRPRPAGPGNRRAQAHRTAGHLRVAWAIS